MQINDNSLSSLNYQLNMRYQETNAQAILKTDTATYKIDIKAIQLDFQLKVSGHSGLQFGEQNEWQALASKLMKNAPSLPHTPEEAKEVISEDGFYGIKQTSERLAQFVILGAGDDEGLLKAGREGIIRGYKEAEKMWGDELPEISQETLKKALEMIDEHVSKLGYNILDIEG